MGRWFGSQCRQRLAVPPGDRTARWGIDGLKVQPGHQRYSARTHRYTDHHADEPANRYADEYPNQHADEDPNQHPHGYPDQYPNQHANQDTNRYPDQYAHQHPHAEPDRDADA